MDFSIEVYGILFGGRGPSVQFSRTVDGSLLRCSAVTGYCVFCSRLLEPKSFWVFLWFFFSWFPVKRLEVQTHWCWKKAALWWRSCRSGPAVTFSSRVSFKWQLLLWLSVQTALSRDQTPAEDEEWKSRSRSWRMLFSSSSTFFFTFSRAPKSNILWIFHLTGNGDKIRNSSAYSDVFSTLLFLSRSLEFASWSKNRRVWYESNANGICELCESWNNLMTMNVSLYGGHLWPCHWLCSLWFVSCTVRIHVINVLFVRVLPGD